MSNLTQKIYKIKNIIPEKILHVILKILFIFYPAKIETGNCIGSPKDNEYSSQSQVWFIIKILEIFPGTRCSSNNVFQFERAKLLKREDYWMKTLRTIYTYGLNERSRKHDSEVQVGKLFFSISTIMFITF